jgi:hypothetical protein
MECIYCAVRAESINANTVHLSYQSVNFVTKCMEIWQQFAAASYSREAKSYKTEWQPLRWTKIFLIFFFWTEGSITAH